MQNSLESKTAIVALIVGCLFFSYLTVGLVIDSRLQLEDLILEEGVVVRTEISQDMGRGRQKSLYLTLSSGSSFRIPSEFVGEQEQALKLFKSGISKVKLFHRTPSQIIWRFGKVIDIYHLEIGDSIILDINRRSGYSKSLKYLTISGSLLLGMLAIVGIVKRNKMNRR